MKKRISAAILAVAMIFFLTACTVTVNGDGDSSTNPSSVGESQTSGKSETTTDYKPATENIARFKSIVEKYIDVHDYDVNVVNDTFVEYSIKEGKNRFKMDFSFAFGGKKMALPVSFNDIISAGWVAGSLTDKSYLKVDQSPLAFKSDDFYAPSGRSVNFTFVNSSGESKGINECGAYKLKFANDVKQINGVDVPPINFTVLSGIKNSSTLEDIFTVANIPSKISITDGGVGFSPQVDIEYKDAEDNKKTVQIVYLLDNNRISTVKMYYLVDKTLENLW